jgi:hypothetical protein
MDSVGALVIPCDEGLDNDMKQRTAKPMECSACSVSSVAMVRSGWRWFGIVELADESVHAIWCDV